MSDVPDILLEVSHQCFTKGAVPFINVIIYSNNDYVKSIGFKFDPKSVSDEKLVDIILNEMVRTKDEYRRTIMIARKAEKLSLKRL